MSTESVTEPDSSGNSLGDLLSDYAIVIYPLAFGLLLIGAGWLLDQLGRGAGAGVSAATGIILCGITVVVYLIFWSLGRFGH